MTTMTTTKERRTDTVPSLAEAAVAVTVPSLIEAAVVWGLMLLGVLAMVAGTVYGAIALAEGL